MSEMKQKIPSIRAGERVFKWLKDTQHARFNATGNQPTYEELLEEAVLHKATPTKDSATVGAPSALNSENEFDRLSGLLREIMRSGNEGIVRAITGNIEEFAKAATRAADIPGRSLGDFDDEIARGDRVGGQVDQFIKETSPGKAVDRKGKASRDGKHRAGKVGLKQDAV